MVKKLNWLPVEEISGKKPAGFAEDGVSVFVSCLNIAWEYVFYRFYIGV
jgi:hypothetical protein